ncbi:MAG: DNA mismatch repair endonuclease MutL [Eubacteriales bacterium]|nr:DNA mismatch repair endonuclease MutL [Eubacteriales bacterium]
MAERPIQILSDEVIGQIAAGEVVERPAAAVKELVENSIDAGATAVTVELKDGGITSIRVSDNGRGIPAAQVRMAFARHATSKLQSAEELFDVHTLGFRGEALASIASVSKVECTTRTAGAEFGVKVRVDGGAFVSVTEAASPVGTTIVVRDLFFNAPVRLKFLKKPTSEAAYVSDYIMRLIFSRPEVAFRFVNQGKTIYRSAGDGTLESAIYCVYGREALQAMRRVKGAHNGVFAEGFVGVGELARGNRLQQSFFVNGRYFRDEAMSRALERGCEGYVMVGRYPIGILALTLPYRQVDVNVHPNKLEVRFQRPDDVADAVETIVREALKADTIQSRFMGAQPGPAAPGTDSIRLVTLDPDDAMEDETLMPDVPRDGAKTPTLMEFKGILNDASEALLASEGSAWLTDNAFAAAENEPVQMEYAADAWEESALAQEMPVVMEDMTGTEMTFLLPQETPSEYAENAAPQPQGEQQAMQPAETQLQLRYIGAAFRTYLLFEAGERLLLVDQHAAHERILYDRFMARYQGERVSQPLLSPQTVRLTARDVGLLAETREAFFEAGFDVEAISMDTVAVRAIPLILGQNVPVREFLTDMLDDPHLRRGKITQETLRGHIAQMACKHAVKGGDTLSEQDVRALIQQMLDTGTQPTCPHGRPIVSVLTRRELEKRFKRIQ